MEDKKSLRKKTQLERDRLTAAEKAEKSKTITLKFLDTDDYKKANSILIYHPFRSEIDTTQIIEKALKDGKKVILPKVKNKNLNLFFVEDLQSQLKKGAFGIMEPIESTCPEAEPGQIDLAVIPGVCFDKSLNRVGYGGGFYDRLIPLLPEGVKKIALCFDLQIVPKIPVSRSDRKVDRIITESRDYGNHNLGSPTRECKADKSEYGDLRMAILIPAYNEGKHIEDVIRKCLKYRLDIIVVDDGSRDNTVEVVRKFSDDPETAVFLLKHGVNMGKGEALKTGFAYAIDKKYTGVITIDADGQHDVEEIADFLNAFKEKEPDIIVGSRFQNVKGMPFIRLATNFFTSWIISAIAGRKINDVQSGFRFIGYKVLKNIKLETKNFETEPEVLMKASWLKYRIINIPITTIYHENFVSHVNPFTDTYKFFRLVFRSMLLKRRFMRSHTNL